MQQNLLRREILTEIESEMTRENGRKCPASNERFGATAAGSADLKGSAEMPPLRKASEPLGVSVESVVDKVV
jgi:hypothetical protein